MPSIMDRTRGCTRKKTYSKSTARSAGGDQRPELLEAITVTQIKPETPTAKAPDNERKNRYRRRRSPPPVRHTAKSMHQMIYIVAKTNQLAIDNDFIMPQPKPPLSALDPLVASPSGPPNSLAASRVSSAKLSDAKSRSGGRSKCTKPPKQSPSTPDLLVASQSGLPPSLGASRASSAKSSDAKANRCSVQPSHFNMPPPNQPLSAQDLLVTSPPSPLPSLTTSRASSAKSSDAKTNQHSAQPSNYNMPATEHPHGHVPYLLVASPSGTMPPLAASRPPSAKSLTSTKSHTVLTKSNMDLIKSTQLSTKSSERLTRSKQVTNKSNGSPRRTNHASTKPSEGLSISGHAMASSRHAAVRPNRVSTRPNQLASTGPNKASTGPNLASAGPNKAATRSNKTATRPTQVKTRINETQVKSNRTQSRSSPSLAKSNKTPTKRSEMPKKSSKPKQTVPEGSKQVKSDRLNETPKLSRPKMNKSVPAKYLRAQSERDDVKIFQEFMASEKKTPVTKGLPEKRRMEANRLPVLHARPWR